MNFYRIGACRMPWGDYGSILASGMSAHLGRENGFIQLERTGPFIPPISFPGIGDIIVTDAFRAALECSGLTGFAFAPIIKAHVVELAWETWDRTAAKPKAYPEGGEPESYILAQPHSYRAAERIGVLWELVVSTGGTVERRATGPKSWDVEIVLKAPGQSDFFRAEGVGYNFVSQAAMEWLVTHAGEWVEGRAARVARCDYGDDEFVETLRQRSRVAPRERMGDYDKPEAYAPAPPDLIAVVEAKLGTPLPPVLRRIYSEVADGGFGPGCGLFPLAEHVSDRGHAETLVEAREKLSQDPTWPTRLLPLCDWGCAIWSCLDCRGDDGAIVTTAGEHPFANTGHTLRSWLGAWLDGEDLWARMFEPGPTRMGINPFTKQPMELKGQGKPRGTPWP